VPVPPSIAVEENGFLGGLPVEPAVEGFAGLLVFGGFDRGTEVYSPPVAIGGVLSPLEATLPTGQAFTLGGGDFNGDGIEDAFADRSVYWGPLFDLESPDVEVGARTGDFIVASPFTGTEVQNLDDDGPDSILYANSYDTTAGGDTGVFEWSRGAAYLVRGPVAEGASLDHPEVLFLGDETDVNFGADVTPAGDTNGDGFADVTIGSAASFYLFEEPFDPEETLADAEFRTSTLAGGGGGEGKGVGDWNGDGYDDLGGLPWNGNALGVQTCPCEGSLLVDDFPIQVEQDVALVGRASFYKMAPMGDVNSDGEGDVALYDGYQVFVVLGGAGRLSESPYVLTQDVDFDWGASGDTSLLSSYDFDDHPGNDVIVSSYSKGWIFLFSSADMPF